MHSHRRHQRTGHPAPGHTGDPAATQNWLNTVLGTDQTSLPPTHLRPSLPPFSALFPAAERATEPPRPALFRVTDVHVPPAANPEQLPRLVIAHQPRQHLSDEPFHYDGRSATNTTVAAVPPAQPARRSHRLDHPEGHRRRRRETEAARSADLAGPRQQDLASKDRQKLDALTKELKDRKAKDRQLRDYMNRRQDVHMVIMQGLADRVTEPRVGGGRGEMGGRAAAPSSSSEVQLSGARRNSSGSSSLEPELRLAAQLGGKYLAEARTLANPFQTTTTRRRRLSSSARPAQPLPSFKSLFGSSAYDNNNGDNNNSTTAAAANNTTRRAGTHDPFTYRSIWGLANTSREQQQQQNQQQRKGKRPAAPSDNATSLTGGYDVEAESTADEICEEEDEDEDDEDEDDENDNGKKPYGDETTMTSLFSSSPVAGRASAVTTATTTSNSNSNSNSTAAIAASSSSATAKKPRYSVPRQKRPRYARGPPGGPPFQYVAMPRTVVGIWTQWHHGGDINNTTTTTTTNNNKDQNSGGDPTTTAAAAAATAAPAPSIESLERTYGTAWRTGSNNDIKYGSNYVGTRYRIVRYVEERAHREGVDPEDVCRRLDEHVARRIQLLLGAIKRDEDPFVVIPPKK